MSIQTESFNSFIIREILPHADDHDKKERVSQTVISKLASQGYLGATVSRSNGGMGMDLLTFGLLNFELGKGCTAVRSLITVQSMVTQVIERWGTDIQKISWLNLLATGQKIGAFALTEPERGSDAAAIQTEITRSNDSYIIFGKKKWISFGQMADVFLVFGQQDGRICCLLVEKDTPGLTITPISGVLGARGSMLATLEFEDCRVPETNLVGGIGFGLHPVAFTALDMGRYSIAWGCVGMAQACLEASVKYVKSRKQFGSYLHEHQLIQAIISDMAVDIKAARLLCEHAGRLKASNDRTFMREMLVAKYFAAGAAGRVSGKAVQIHGANGYSQEYVVERFFRDAKIMETIEGSNQMMQILIAKYEFQEHE